jgi:hypothetical protein
MKRWEVAVKVGEVYTGKLKIVDAQVALEIAVNLGAPREVIDFFVKRFIEKGLLSTALWAAKLGASQEILEELTEGCILNGWVVGSQEAARLRGRALSTEEMERLLRCAIFQCSLNDVEEALRLLKRSFTPEELAELVKIWWDAGWIYGCWIAMKKFGAPPELVESFLEGCIQEGYVELVEEITRVMGKELTREEIERLISNCLRKGELKSAQKAAKWIPRELTLDELKYLNNVLNGQ